MRRLRIEVLQWAVAAFCAFTGAVMLVAPHQFSSPAYAALQPHLTLWGVLYLLTGAALVLTAIFKPHRITTGVAHLAAGALLLWLAYGFATMQAWTGATYFTVLGGGTLLALVLALRPPPSAPDGDLLTLVLSIGAVINGLVMLGFPDQFNSPLFDPIRPWIGQSGAGFLIGGMALTVVILRPSTPRMWVVMAHLLLSVVFFFWLVISAIPGRFWTGIALYGGGAVLLAVLPWIQSRLERLNPASLRVRFALALAAIAAVPLILQATLVTGQQEQLATEQALTLQQRIVGSLAAYTKTYVDLHRSAAGMLAAHPNLLTLSHAEQESLLHTYAATYPDIRLIGLYDAAGNVLIRSDGTPGRSITDLPVFQDARATNQPSMQILVGRTLNRPVLSLGSPIRDGSGQFAGLVIVSIETAQIAQALSRANVSTIDIDRIYLVDAQGRVIAHPDKQLAEMFADLSDTPPVAAWLTDQHSVSAFSYGPTNNVQLVGYADVPGLGWGVIAERPQSMALAGLRAGRDLTFGMLVLLSAAALVVGTMLARQLTAPLTGLARALRQLATHAADVVLPFSTITEIKVLTTAFNDLRTRLDVRTRERDEAERFLRDERERLLVTLSSIGDAVIATDDQGRITFMNPIAQTVTGWTQADAFGRPVEDVFPIVNEDTHQAVANPVTQVMQRGMIVGLANHTALITRDGREIPIDDSGAPIRDAQGNIIGVILVFRDVTERRQADARLHEAQSRLQLALSAANMAAWDWDLTTGIITAPMLYGGHFAVDAGTTDAFGQRIHPDDRAMVNRAQADAWAGGGYYDVEYRVIDPDGTVRWLHCVGQTQFAEQPARQPRRMTGVISDVTTRKRTEIALRDSESRLRRLVESDIIGVVYPDEAGNINEANDAFLNMVGYSRDDLRAGRVRWKDMTPPEYLPLDERGVAEAQERGSCTPYEKEYMRKDGSRIPIMIGYALLAESHTEYIGFILDLTARKRAENALKYLTEASIVLSSTLDLEIILANLRQVIIPRLADVYAIDLLQPDGSIQRLASATASPIIEAALTNIAHRLPTASSGTHVAGVWQSGQPLIVSDDSVSQLSGQSAVIDETHVALLRHAGIQSLQLLPLVIRDQVIGLLAMGYTASGQRYTDADLVFGDLLARRVALAIDNAQLYEAAQQARRVAEANADRVTRLYTIAVELSQAFTPEQVAQVIISQGSAALGASAGGLVLLRDDATLELIYSTGYTPEQLRGFERYEIDTPVPTAEAARTRQPIWLESPEERTARYPSVAARNVPYGAWAVLPLMLDNRVLGSVSLNFPTPRQFSDEDKAFLLAWAQQCAQALDRSLLYAAVQNNAETLRQTVEARTADLQQALKRAEAADRAKVRMLSNVSHEMRTPLSSIVGFSNLILARELDQAKLHEYVTTINKEGRRLNKLVNDFLDLQRIEAGREVFRFAPCDLASLLQEVVNQYSTPDQSHHTFRLEVARVAPVWADEDRIRQVVLNLLSNAIKYSPDGGEIVLALCQRDNEVTFTIRDEGLGIPSEELSQLFERFQRGEMAELLRIQGTGLGLALCKEIISRHNGRIWAESDGENAGATFGFALPAMS
ncbi:MAG: PAS domain S-box protein [Anaerolineae bacterium]|nr:PAS domain S-box protein [Anaerolineae bacterium]